jgi:hypothetical protein
MVDQEYQSSEKFFIKSSYRYLSKCTEALKPTRPSSVVVHNNPGAVILKVKST